MRKIKIFQFNGHCGELPQFEDQINEFLEANKAVPIRIDLDSKPMHDLFYNGEICNQWHSNTAVLIYEQNENNKI